VGAGMPHAQKHTHGQDTITYTHHIHQTTRVTTPLKQFFFHQKPLKTSTFVRIPVNSMSIIRFSSFFLRDIKYFDLASVSF